jgi:cadmium resistance protein CadD (predicted permease)
VHEDSLNNGPSKNICVYIQARNHTPVICVGKLLLIVPTSPSIKRQVFKCNIIIQFSMFVNLWKLLCMPIEFIHVSLISGFHGILPAALGPGVCWATNRNEYQTEMKNLWELERCRCMRVQPHCHLLADCLDNVGTLTSHSFISLHSLLWGSFTFLLFTYDICL